MVLTAKGGFYQFVKHCVFIKSGLGRKIKFEIWPCHFEIFEALEDDQMISILKARQIGMSWLLGAARPVFLCLIYPGSTSLLFSTRDDETAELLKKCKFVIDNMPQWLKTEIKPDNSQELGFVGLDSHILAFPSKPTAGSGYTAIYALSDEHAKQEYASEQYSSILPTIEEGGQYVSVSTAYGGSSFHQQLWEKARDGSSSAKALFFPYNARPGRDKDWWDRMRRAFANKESQFFQEYPRTPEEAVQFSIPRFFDRTTCTTTASVQTPIASAGDNEDLKALLSAREWEDCAGVRVYQKVVAGHHYVIGADVSEGIDQDRQAAICLDADTGEEVAIIHGGWTIDEYAGLIFRMAQYYGAVICPERNNHGGSLIVHLQALIQREMRRKGRVRCRLYYETPLINNAKGTKRPALPGMYTSGRTKPVVLDNLNTALKEQDVLIATRHIASELLRYARLENGKLGAEPGHHDDLVMALAIAWQMVLVSPRPQARPRIPFAMGQNAGELSKTWAQRERLRQRKANYLENQKRTPMLQRIRSRRSPQAVRGW